MVPMTNGPSRSNQVTTAAQGREHMPCAKGGTLGEDTGSGRHRPTTQLREQVSTAACGRGHTPRGKGVLKTNKVRRLWGRIQLRAQASKSGSHVPPRDWRDDWTSSSPDFFVLMKQSESAVERGARLIFKNRALLARSCSLVGRAYGLLAGFKRDYRVARARITPESKKILTVFRQCCAGRQHCSAERSSGRNLNTGTRIRNPGAIL